MNQTCDRCGPAVRAAYRVNREGELYFCRHCTSRLWAVLSAQGWAIWAIGQQALVPQAGSPFLAAMQTRNGNAGGPADATGRCRPR